MHSVWWFVIFLLVLVLILLIAFLCYQASSAPVYLYRPGDRRRRRRRDFDNDGDVIVVNNNGNGGGVALNGRRQRLAQNVVPTQRAAIMQARTPAPTSKISLARATLLAKARPAKTARPVIRGGPATLVQGPNVTVK